MDEEEKEWKIDDYLPVVNQISRFVAHDFPNVEQDEIKTELTVWLMERKPSQPPDNRLLFRALRRRAKGYALYQRSVALHKSVQYEYRPSDVRRILEDLWVSDRASQFVPGDARSTMDTSMDGSDTAADISWALELLPETDYFLLCRKYRFAHTLEDSQERKIRRIVDRLTDILNSYARGSWNK